MAMTVLPFGPIARRTAQIVDARTTATVAGGTRVWSYR